MLFPSKFDRFKDSWEKGKKDLERGCSETRALYRFARTRYRPFSTATIYVYADADVADLEIAAECLRIRAPIFINVWGRCVMIREECWKSIANIFDFKAVERFFCLINEWIMCQKKMI